MRITKHVAMFSTGLSSAWLLEWMIKQFDKENVIPFFTDTLWEDEDNYRFMDEVLKYLQIEPVIFADGRTPEEVFFEEHFFGNFGTAPCSTELKMKQTVIFIEELRLQGIEPILYFGIGRKERVRAKRIAMNYSHNCLEPVVCRFPLVKKVKRNMNNDVLTDIIQNEWGIRRPRMYDYGFSHANCAGRCVKGGIKHYTTLYKIWPDRFKAQEEMERKFRNEIADYTFLNRFDKPYPLEQLRKDIEKSGYQQDFIINSEVELPCACVI